MTFDFALCGARARCPSRSSARRPPPLRAGQSDQPRFRAVQALDRQDRQGRPQVRRLAVHRDAASRPRSTRPSCRSATPCSRCACPTTATRRSCQSAVSDTGSGLLEFLPALGQREAIAFGDGVSLPVRIKFDELPKSAPAALDPQRASPRSWQKPPSATRTSSSRSSSAGVRHGLGSAGDTGPDSADGDVRRGDGHCGYRPKPTALPRYCAACRQAPAGSALHACPPAAGSANQPAAPRTGWGRLSPGSPPTVVSPPAPRASAWNSATPANPLRPPQQRPEQRRRYGRQCRSRPDAAGNRPHRARSQQSRRAMRLLHPTLANTLIPQPARPGCCSAADRPRRARTVTIGRAPP